MFIDDLKKSILQKAIQWKLVEQNPNDEPASELLKKIREEKEKLIKDGKIKKEKNLSPITDEEKLFDIPGSWEWVKLGEISSLNIWKTPDRKNSNYWIDWVVNWFSISDLEDCQIVSETKEKVSELAINDCFKSWIAPAWTLLMSFKLTIWKTSILWCDAVFNEAIVSILPIINDWFITRDFLLKFLPMLAKDGNTKNAIMWATLNKESLNNLIIPLPPLEEQKRIVAKLDELMPLLDEARPLEEEITKLEKDFPSKLRQSILQYAIQWKLVEQNSEDEPASELLKKIKEEKDKLIKEWKIKKEKPLEPITDEEKPFEIPSNWEWVRLGEIFQHNTWKTQNASTSKNVWTLRKFITTSNLYWNSFDFTAVKEMYFSDDEIERYSTKKWDLLVCEWWEYGRSAIWNSDESICFQNHIHRLRPFYKNLCIQFFYYLMFFYKSNQLIKWTWIGIQWLSSWVLHNIVFPLPPLEEQKRIVAKLDELLNLCDELEEQINK